MKFIIFIKSHRSKFIYSSIFLCFKLWCKFNNPHLYKADKNRGFFNIFGQNFIVNHLLNKAIGLKNRLEQSNGLIS